MSTPRTILACALAEVKWIASLISSVSRPSGPLKPGTDFEIYTNKCCDIGEYPSFRIYDLSEYFV